MSTVEAETAAPAPASQETPESQDKMSVDGQQHKAEEKEEEKKGEEKAGVTPRRSSRISTTASVAPASNGTPTKAKRGPGKPAKKRSADDVADSGAADGKSKKVRFI